MKIMSAVKISMKLKRDYQNKMCPNEMYVKIAR